MEIICVEIKTADEEYGRVLQTVLKRNYRGFLLRLLVPGQQRPGGWAADVVLCDGPQLWESGDVLLVESPAEENLVARDKRLFKYAPAGEMVGKILTLCAHGKNRRIHYDSTGGMKISVVAAAKGGVGCTVVALALAREMVQTRGLKVMYLSFAPIAREDYLRLSATAMEGREFLYRILAKQEEDDGLLMRAEARDEYGVLSFHWGEGYNLLPTLKGEEISRFLAYLAKSGYDHVVLDVGTTLCEASLETLAAADRIVFIKSFPHGDKKYLDYLAHVGAAGLSGKLLAADNKWKEDDALALSSSPKKLMEEFYEEREALFSDGARADYRLPAEEKSFVFRGEVMDMDLTGAFGKAIRSLLNPLLQ